MFSQINNDALACVIKSNPEFEPIIKTIIDDNKKTTSMFVHELRNPLSLLKGTIQYIEQKHPEAASYKYWDQMEDLLDDMEHIMADASLLNICNYIHKENVNLITLINNVTSSFMPQALTEHIDLAITVEPGSEEYFNSYPCDSIKIKQVLGNLIKNAFEATKAGNYIHINLKYLPGECPLPSKLSIQISNNGYQIPDDVIHDIFIPFVTHKKGGTGIGLALVKKVIDLHYGSICVDSNPDLTSFTIQLPL
ncbi:MAG: HAMP domain-containing sensor histidine kinase [Herbinix sp.]|nr:HAMP domain-containing sensor histidine kinase [Herbinix sp.]